MAQRLNGRENMESGGHDAVGLVVFDLDGTLTGRDVFREFSLRLRPRRQRLAALACMGGHFIGALDNDGLKRQILRRWLATGRRKAETVEAAVLSSASSVFPDMVDWLSRYQSAGYTVVVATASPRFLAEPVLARIGIGGVLLVAAEARLEDGVFHYESCYGAEKLARLRSRFPRRELGLVVSDSDSDSASLRAAKAEVMVSRGVKVSSRGVFPGMEP